MEELDNESTMHTMECDVEMVTNRVLNQANPHLSSVDWQTFSSMAAAHATDLRECGIGQQSILSAKASPQVQTQMSVDAQIRIDCYRATDEIEAAKALYAWVVGRDV